MRSYTKGQWKTESFKHEGKTFAGVFAESKEFYPDDSCHRKAIARYVNTCDAHLIAAAPALYEALKYLVAQHATTYEMLARGIGTKTEHGKMMLSAKQAIAQAEGK